MRIYRGNIGIDLTLEEFSDVINDESCLEDLLDTIYELERDEVMNYDEAEIRDFEKRLYAEVSEQQKQMQTNDELLRMERTLNRLEKYGQ